MLFLLASFQQNMQVRGSNGRNGACLRLLRLRLCSLLQSCRKDAGKAEMDAILAREEARWERLSTTQKITDFVTRHEYGVILGSWAMAMTGAFAYIMRDPCVPHSHLVLSQCPAHLLRCDYRIQTVPQKARLGVVSFTASSP